MKKAQVTNGLVVNVIEVDPNNIPEWCADWPDAGASGIGWTFSNGDFSPPAPVTIPVPQTISFAQMLIGLVSEGWITETEGQGWLDGTLPAAVTSLISSLPEEDRFPALARAKRPSSIARLDPLVIALAAAQGKTSQELDDFFTTYAAV